MFLYLMTKEGEMIESSTSLYSRELIDFRNIRKTITKIYDLLDSNDGIHLIKKSYCQREDYLGLKIALHQKLSEARLELSNFSIAMDKVEEIVLGMKISLEREKMINKEEEKRKALIEPLRVDITGQLKI